MRPPRRLTVPASLGVSMRSRGAAATAVTTGTAAPGTACTPVAPGDAVVPAATCVGAAFGVGKYRSDRKVQPSSTSADSAMARIMLRWSVTQGLSTSKLSGNAGVP